MITQFFRYRKIFVTLGTERFCIIIPFYENNTYLAMDPTGQIFTYDTIPLFDKSVNQYIIDEKEHSYDLVATYNGVASKFVNNIIAIADKQYEYNFVET